MSLFERIFGTNKNVQKGEQVQMLNNTFGASFSNYDGLIFNSAEIRACIDAIARNVAKQSVIHIRQKGKRFEVVDDELGRLIGEQPNELMNAYDFYYRMTSELLLNNNSFAYIQRDEKGKVTGLYPIKAGCYELVQYGKDLYIQFHFGSGKTYTASVRDDVIHLKRFYSSKDFEGEGNKPIVELMSFKHVVNEGIVNAIKTTQGVKGILKTEKTMLKPEDVKATRDRFVQDFISNSDGSGIAGLDATTSFTSVNIDPKTATDEQINQINTDVMNYFGVNEAILSSKFSETEWIAFYQSTLQPIVAMFTQEMTNKIFTYDERRRGNKIKFRESALDYVSIQQKIQLVKEFGNYLSINEARQIIDLEPIEDEIGDKYLQNLNYVNSSIADLYQLKGVDLPKDTKISLNDNKEGEDEQQ